MQSRLSVSTRVFYAAFFIVLPLFAGEGEKDTPYIWNPLLENYIQKQIEDDSAVYLDEKTELLLFPGINSENEKEDSLSELKRIVETSQGAVKLEVYWPDSLKSAIENARKITGILENKIRHRESDDSKLLLVGHSKGGLELLLACMIRPELCNSSAVSLVTILQAPVMGTRTADELFNENGKPLGFFKFIFFFIPEDKSKVLLGPGMQSVRTKSVERTYKTFDFDYLRENLNKVIFVAGNESVKNWSKELRVPNRKFVGDGIIPLGQARHPELSLNPSYVLQADHLDLVVDLPRSNKENSYKSAFWKSLLKLRERLLVPNL